jgi:hypothetical protein
LSDNLGAYDDDVTQFELAVCMASYFPPSSRALLDPILRIRKIDAPLQHAVWRLVLLATVASASYLCAAFFAQRFVPLDA